MAAHVRQGCEQHVLADQRMHGSEQESVVIDLCDPGREEATPMQRGRQIRSVLLPRLLGQLRLTREQVGQGVHVSAAFMSSSNSLM
jgi:hypothetical protein